MNDYFCSEYKTTFCEPPKCILTYIMSKGYFLEKFHGCSFEYDPFNNHFSSDMDEKLIGFIKLDVHINSYNVRTESKRIHYMSEYKFNTINNKLEKHISQSGFDNVLSSTNKTHVLIKRGVRFDKTRVCERGQLREFNILIEKGSAVEQFNFLKCDVGFKFCTLELVGIRNNSNEGFIPVEEKQLEEQATTLEIDVEISKLKLSVSSLVQESHLKYENILSENQELKSLIYGMLDEINELKEHNKSLSERIELLENKPPIILC